MTQLNAFAAEWQPSRLGFTLPPVRTAQPEADKAQAPPDAGIPPRAASSSASAAETAPLTGAHSSTDSPAQQQSSGQSVSVPVPAPPRTAQADPAPSQPSRLGLPASAPRQLPAVPQAVLPAISTAAWSKPVDSPKAPLSAFSSLQLPKPPRPPARPSDEQLAARLPANGQQPEALASGSELDEADLYAQRSASEVSSSVRLSKLPCTRA